jgi:putative nucleotidyltransferase with HDIG domain
MEDMQDMEERIKYSMYSIIKERFMDYINSISFNQEQANILNILKLSHTHRVDELSEILAESVFENDAKRGEYVALAKVIGVLHDIGRWNQMKTHNGFSDNLAKTDHGEIGADIISQNDILNGIESNYRQVILTAVREHNKRYIDTYDDFTQIFLNIIRDADRLDNLYVEVENYSNKADSMKSVLPYSDEHKLSPRIYENVMSGTLADVKDLETKIDFKFLKMLWCFDMKTAKSLEIIREQKYIEDIYADINSPDETMQTAYEKIQQYLKSV